MGKYEPLAAAMAAGQTDVGSLFHATAMAFPGHLAVVDGARKATYSELEERSNRLANALTAMGLAHGDRVAILAGNVRQYVELELAAAKTGIIIAALNWRLAHRELQHCVDLVEPTLLVLSPDKRPALTQVELGKTRILELGDDYESALANASPQFPNLRIDPEAGLVILYTSGTTGLPKGALISHRAMASRALVFSSTVNIPAHDHFIAWAPMFHMASTDQALAQLMRGGTVHMVDGYQPHQLIDVIEQVPMQWLLLMPGMITSFCETWRERAPQHQPIGCIGAMADLIPRHEIAEVTRLLNAPFLNTFGATETGLCPATGALIGIGAAPERLPKQQTPFCDVRLVDADDREVPIGTPGEVTVAGPTLFSGYWNNDETNNKDFRGGRFHMGDVLRRNPDGTLEYVDRVKYMIKSGGENIYPAEIEQVVEADPRVATAVVVRRADPRWGEVPVLFIVPRTDGLQVADIMALCDGTLSRYKRPRDVQFVADADLPRSTTGKIQRHILEERLG
jgi:acyl-CoA synthetase (AMP-forming)/AMP-acid ligase II